MFQRIHVDGKDRIARSDDKFGTETPILKLLAKFESKIERERLTKLSDFPFARSENPAQ